ncbi:MAG: post-transcriptional regulator [Bacillaceae bacterium]|nr:post-transcriptional regulator [Bacillaceae bacterium]
MEEKKRVSQWKPFIMPALTSKAEELHMLGYERATIAEVWDCLMKKVWKKDPEKRLHEVVQDILHLSPGIYMSYMTAQVYQDQDLLAQINALKEMEDNHSS